MARRGLLRLTDLQYTSASHMHYHADAIICSQCDLDSEKLHSTARDHLQQPERSIISSANQPISVVTVSWQSGAYVLQLRGFLVFVVCARSNNAGSNAPSLDSSSDRAFAEA